ncbi:S46 family peptidase [Oleiagrimonas sp. C23AA]|uniref:S46 family peptidase n=1 Tax=Oleiagrimonas sp. C23AA TaxID=2719047 RepID=UPI00141ED164|nr:S46 family peptidase [Oleiagrimonas sp. C23AA]NII09733.1 S46 family peptidase [Oleiagrimonas sp. C23AA]
MKRMMYVAAIAAVTVFAGRAMADEGMWTLNHLPLKQMKQRYGFAPDKAWVDRVQHAAVRLAEGCSGSFVSADGLVMTNHHCANGCLSQLSHKGNYMQDGFTADSLKDEPKCPDVELNQLDSITDVTAKVNAATDGKSGSARIKAQRAIDAKLEQGCVGGDAKHWRCDVISLYHGGRYALYKYRRFQDVRLVFAPEQSIAFFGGDPDNFNFPRYDLDVTFFRAYVDGKPEHTADYLKFDPKGPEAGEMTFVVGNPGSTQRQTPWIELANMRDRVLTPFFGYLSEKRGVLWEYSRGGQQQAKAAQDALFGIDNSLKVFKGWLSALGNESFIEKKKSDDAALRKWIAADASRRTKYGDPWGELEKAQQASARLRDRYAMIERGQGFDAGLFDDARMLVRAAAERAKPNSERLPAYRDANLPALEQELSSTAPVYPKYQETTLAWSLEKMRQALGADSDFVHEVLGDKSPQQLAQAVVSGTKLGDPKVREQLWKGGEKAIEASDDPMIRLALKIDPQARAVRKQYEAEVTAPMTKADEAIAKARFARDGATSYPDATFTLRLSYGKVVGWQEKGKPVPPFTHFDGLYKRATGADPFKLPESWLKAKSSLDPATPMDFVTDNDIIGGNSGSPVIDKQGHAVGLIFDGNIHSLAGNFYFDPSNNRAVAVDTAAIDHALRKVYHLPRLAEELENGHL